MGYRADNTQKEANGQGRLNKLRRAARVYACEGRVKKQESRRRQ